MERGGSSRGQGGSSASHQRPRAGVSGSGNTGATPNMGSRQGPQGEGGGEVGREGQTVREHDWFMPMTNLIRIMRRVLPGHAKISDDAKETIQDCVSGYISIVTGEANRRCQLEQRKTITADDVLWAMKKIGLDDYVGPLSVYLHNFRAAEQMPPPRPVIRKEAGPIHGGGFLHHIQQPHYGMHGGGNGVLKRSSHGIGEGSSSGAGGGGGVFYSDFENTGGPGGGGLL